MFHPHGLQNYRQEQEEENQNQGPWKQQWDLHNIQYATMLTLTRLGTSQVFLAGLVTFWCILVKRMFADIVLKNNVSISLLVKLMSLTILFKSFLFLK